MKVNRKGVATPSPWRNLNLQSTRPYYQLLVHQISASSLAYSIKCVFAPLPRCSASKHPPKLINGLSKSPGFVMLLFIISLSLPSLNDAQGFYDQSKCVSQGWDSFPVWTYRAGPYLVPPLDIDRKLQREFIRLFRGYTGRGGGDSSSSEEESHEEYYPLDIEELKRIAEMCPRDAFFYSMSPKHIKAITMISRMITAQQSPLEVLQLARALLRSPYVNPKVWYNGVIAGAEERPDMTGFMLAHPVDAMPDLLIPGPMLLHLKDRHRSTLKDGSGHPVNGTLVKGKNNMIRKQWQNQTIADLFTNIATGRAKKKNKKVVKSKDVQSRAANKLKQRSSPDRISRSKRDLSSPKPTSKKDKKKKTNKKIEHAPEVDGLLAGNVTEYRADASMGRSSNIDAFDDCIVVDGSVGIQNGIENKLWYFREDMMVNQHHWYWHQEYFINATRRRSRRGELFFYMHRNLVARYNAERISNGLPLVAPIDIRPGAEIRTHYNSFLADINAGQFWTPRPPGVRLTNIIHWADPDFERNIFIATYNKLYLLLAKSIKVGKLLTKSIKKLKISNIKGIEPLGNTVEASRFSVNPFLYDMTGFHNMGHEIIGLATDPKWKKRLPAGVMAHTITTMRDPEFYSYHTFLDNLFEINKRSLPPYQPSGGQYPLRWEGVEILDVEVISKNGEKSPNRLKTFWANKRFELAPGVDRSIHDGDLNVDVCAVHLDHEPFEFRITVNLNPCTVTKLNKGSVRIFLAPRYDEHGNRFPLNVQRRLMIHMDTFQVDLKVGKNVLYRRSYDSNVLIPWTKHLSDYENSPKHPRFAHFCGCGWPTHLYIPKGSHEGTAFDLFVMITNYDHDYVEENPEVLSMPEPCNSPYMYCGRKLRQYPDAKPMGYPFDRLPFSVPIKCPQISAGPLWYLLLCKFLQSFWYKPVGVLEEYASYAPNMATTVVEIVHLDKLVY